jgi:ABC-2 type transport system permease protein
MKKILTIALREFSTTVLRPGFVLTLIAMPLFFVVVPGVLIYLMNSGPATSTGRPATHRRPAALVDNANIVDSELLDYSHQEPPALASQSRLRGTDAGPDAGFVRYDDLQHALADLGSGRLSAGYVIEPDYLATGNITSYEIEGGLFSSLLSHQTDALDEILRASLLKQHVGTDVVERVNKPVALHENSVSRQGLIKPVTSGIEKIGAVFLPLGMFILLSAAILASSGYLLQSTAEERENRVLEVLISSVTPIQLLVGKIVGLAGAGLLQAAAYLILIGVPSAMFFSASGFGIAKLLICLIYVALGYLLFASLMAATGIISDTVQDSTQYGLIWGAFSVLPILFIQPLSTSPNSVASRLLSFFPLTAPGTMILRTIGSGAPPLDIAISVISLVLGIWLATIAAARLFRTTSLMYGKRFTPQEVLRWLRNS